MLPHTLGHLLASHQDRPHHEVVEGILKHLVGREHFLDDRDGHLRHQVPDRVPLRKRQRDKVTFNSFITGFPQKSHNKIPRFFHGFSMTIYAVFHDARKANTEDHRAYSLHITQKESQISF